ncbi:YhfH family protein [Bacillus aerolatus]|uniref:YhfH family protein n=1 Tax=Bacillus aerolatus TaxID=2653354 RepID=A0A6I1FCN4_9BACI|nr:protein YhfH [Bacillus aerolatus]KAB7704961.1 YhfH family protein [Bacillus aerolatus]
MINNIVDFFKNLPAKQCTKCGSYIEEQHECYNHTCDECTDIKDL